MSRLSRLLLHRTFSTNTNTFQSPSIKSLSQDLFNERDLKSLVHKFKLFSSSDRFRSKSGIYQTTVRRLISSKRFRWIQEILDHQTQFTHDLSKENFTIRIIKLYGQAGMLDHAKKVFDEMPDRNCARTVKSANAILSACVNSGAYDRMEALFAEMESGWNLKPDRFTYNILIKGICEMGRFDRALDLVGVMGERGVGPDLVTFNTLLDRLYAKKRFDDGEKMWKRMLESGFSPNVRSYNARVVGLLNERMFEEAVGLVGEMAKSGIKPDVFSYGAMIRGYCEVGDVGAVKKWYGELVRNECEPDRALFGAVISCACDQGDYGWCVELCEEVFARRSLVDGKVLQKVVDCLAKGSRIEDAKKIVEMGKSNDYCRYKLKLPMEE